MWSDLIFDPLLQGQIMESYLEGSLSHLILLVEAWHVKPTYRKPCLVNLQGQMIKLNFKKDYISLIIACLGLEW